MSATLASASVSCRRILEGRVASLDEGSVFAGRYLVVRCIAIGGMGAVYEVIHMETERRRALKVMHAHILGSEELRGRFKQEARVAAHIESEFIVDVFDAGVDDTTGMPFLVMELLRGEELGQRLKRVGRFSPVEVVRYLQQTGRALDKSHRASIVHRDLKPENLFLTEREEGPPQIKVLDFGIAKVVAEGATAGGVTRTIGTPIYMAPEQFNPSAKLSGAADRYALGMMAYTLLTGAPYWADEAKGGNVFAMATVVVQGPKELASVRAAAKGLTLPPAFDAWFSRIASVEPADRFTTAAEAVAALAQALGVVRVREETWQVRESVEPSPSISSFDNAKAIAAQTNRAGEDARSSAPGPSVIPGPATDTTAFAFPASAAPPMVPPVGVPRLIDEPSHTGAPVSAFSAPRASETEPALGARKLGRHAVLVVSGLTVTVVSLAGGGLYSLRGKAPPPPEDATSTVISARIAAPALVTVAMPAAPTTAEAPEATPIPTTSASAFRPDAKELSPLGSAPTGAARAFSKPLTPPPAKSAAPTKKSSRYTRE